MLQKEETEWPSFEAVLRDVAPSDVARRTQTAIAASRRARSSVDVVRDEKEGSSGSLRVSLEPALADDPAEILDGQVESGDQSATERHFELNLLPDPLPPLELNTSAVRALLEPLGAITDELDFELEALAPLDIVEPALGTAELEVDELDLDARDVVEPAIDELEVDRQNLDSQPRVDSVFDLAFRDSPFHHEPTQEIELPEFGGTPIAIFEDLVFQNELAFDAETPQEVPVEDIPDVAVFELDETAITAFDSNESEIEASGSDGQNDNDAQLLTDVTMMGAFDSVATADEIEGDLRELFTFETEGVDGLGFDTADLDPDPFTSETFESGSFDNVVPIRPEPQSSAADELYSATETALDSFQPIRPQSAADAKHTGWVGLDNTPETSEEDERDPWAYMRLDEEPSTKSLWARRPKLFGGDERKRRKAERRETATHIAEPEDRGAAQLEIAFDSECPNCGDECQVDLDDPIGRHVHVSCPSCDHMWFTPYIPDSKAD